MRKAGRTHLHTEAAGVLCSGTDGTAWSLMQLQLVAGRFSGSVQRTK